MVPYGGWSVAWHKTNETNRRLATIPGVGAAKTKKESHKEQEKLLNRELEDSFPASDPSMRYPVEEALRAKARGGIAEIAHGI